MKTESTVRPELVERYTGLVRINYDVQEHQVTGAEGEEARTVYVYRMLEVPSVEGLESLTQLLVVDKFPLEEQVRILSEGTSADIAGLKDFKFRCKQWARRVLELPATTQSESEVYQAAIDRINAETEEKILTGFKWVSKKGSDKGTEYNVWLSEENQHNYSEAQRVAVLTEGKSLPVKFKMGEDADGKAVYHEFTTVDELTEFYLAAVAFVQECLAEGWEKKDNIVISNGES